MKITVQCDDARLAMTVPKKWVSGSMSQILEAFLTSPTAKKLGLAADADVRMETSTGAPIDADDVVSAKVRDGDVVRVLRGATAAAAAGGGGARALTRHAWQKALTKKAEDFVTCSEDVAFVAGEVSYAVFVVCDGHGGQSAAASAHKRLLPELIAALDRLVDGANGVAACRAAFAVQLPQALRDAFVATNADCVSRGGDAGSTCTVVVVAPGICAVEAALSEEDSDDERQVGDDERWLGPPEELRASAALQSLVVCANVGDSLAYVGSEPAKAMLISHDHRLDRNPAEQMRLQKAGASVGRHKEGKSELVGAAAKQPLRLWPGGLMMSRVLGDADTPLALCVPEVRACVVGSRARVMIASDGLWDELSGKAAFKLVSRDAPARAAQALCDAAKKSGARRGDTDDIVVVVVDVGADAPENAMPAAERLALWDVKTTIKPVRCSVPSRRRAASTGFM